jgi:RsiW-degrading membrane proteinase PrsW (M82 family)
VTEQLGDALLTGLFPQGGVIYDFILYFVVVALSEEGFKYLLLKLRTWKSPHFNCRFDGVVYAVFMSLGFALWENIAYVLEYGFATAVARALTAVPGHACFGVFMGVWYGEAKHLDLAGYPEESKKARRKALWIPILLHGAYDFIASLQSDWMIILFLGFVIWMFRAAVKMIRKSSAEDRPMTKEGLRPELTGEQADTKADEQLEQTNRQTNGQTHSDESD